MCYDFYSCPFEPDICYPECGTHDECRACSWCKVACVMDNNSHQRLSTVSTVIHTAEEKYHYYD